jgi:hypothetical protein
MVEFEVKSQHTHIEIPGKKAFKDYSFLADNQAEETKISRTIHDKDF